MTTTPTLPGRIRFVRLILSTGVLASIMSLPFLLVFEWSFKWSFIWGTFLALLAIIYWLDKFTISVKSNYAVVLADYMQKGKEEDKNVGPEELELVFSGIHDKWPWQYPFATFHLGRMTSIGKKVELIDKGGEGWEIEWQACLNPWRPGLRNLAVTGEADVEAHFHGRTQQTLIVLFGAESGSIYAKDVKALQRALQDEYQGETVTEEEMELGMTIEDIKITSITPNKQAREANEAHAAAMKFAKAVKDIMDADKRVTFVQAQEMVLMTLEQTGVQLLKIAGLEGLGHLHIGDGFMGSASGKGGKGGGKNKKGGTNI